MSELLPGLGGASQAVEQASVGACVAGGQWGPRRGGPAAHGMLGDLSRKMEQAASMLITQPYSIS